MQRPAGPRRKRGHPPHEPTDAQRQMVQVLRSNGIAVRIIAKNIGCDINTLRKHYKTELSDGLAQVVAAMGAALVRTGLAGNVTAQRYWLATHGGPEWRIVEGRQIGGLEGAPPIDINASTVVTVYLPDNGRDRAEALPDDADAADQGDPPA